MNPASTAFGATPPPALSERHLHLLLSLLPTPNHRFLRTPPLRATRCVRLRACHHRRRRLRINADMTRLHSHDDDDDDWILVPAPVSMPGRRLHLRHLQANPARNPSANPMPKPVFLVASPMVSA
ncbi:hypothetical protein DFH09DRAFT_1313219 [Mycena vulgaris]|nr:hypothetical protein DFH09DRAFT_1313219 [Mycena vulgaris]